MHIYIYIYICKRISFERCFLDEWGSRVRVRSSLIDYLNAMVVGVRHYHASIAIDSDAAIRVAEETIA